MEHKDLGHTGLMKAAALIGKIKRMSANAGIDNSHRFDDVSDSYQSGNINNLISFSEIKGSFLKVVSRLLPKNKKPAEKYAWLEDPVLLEKKQRQSEAAAKKNLKMIAAGAVFACILYLFFGRSELESMLKRPDEGIKTITLKARFSQGEETLIRNIRIDVVPEGYKKEETEESQKTASEILGETAAALGSLLSSDSSGASLRLPSEFGGADICWYAPDDNTLLIIISGAVFLLILQYFMQYEELNRNLEKERQELERELPGLFTQITLLISGGLVLSSALEQICEDCEGKETPLSRLLIRINSQSRAANEPFLICLYKYAQMSGIRDFVRAAGIISQSGMSGGEISEKLEKESEALWRERLAHAKAEAKRAETKLSFPLMLLLLALVLISVSPALMTMHQ